jgi:hypothetical protein
MHVFLIDLKNQPGELARATEAIAAKGANITGFSGATCSDSGRVAVMTNDDSTTRAALTESGFKYTEMEATDTALRDEVGSLAKATRRLADAGINIEAAMPIGMEGNEVHVAFVTSDAAKAREVLSAAGMASR